MRALAFGLICLLASACEPPPTNTISASAVVVQTELDAFTVLGADFGDELAVRNWLEGFLCSRTNVFVMHLEARVSGSTGFGHVTFLVGLLESGEPCDGSGVLSVQPASIDEDGEYLVQGPASVEGRNVEAHIPLGSLDGPLVDAFPQWWTLTLSGGDAAIPDRATLTDLRYGELAALWSVPQLASAEDPATGLRLIDAGVAAGRQPDVDVDFDGLERFEDNDGDGRVESCIDGDGTTRRTGAECFEGVRFADAYALRLRMRLVETTLTDPPGLD